MLTPHRPAVVDVPCVSERTEVDLAIVIQCCIVHVPLVSRNGLAPSNYGLIEPTIGREIPKVST